MQILCVCVCVCVYMCLCVCVYIGYVFERVMFNACVGVFIAIFSILTDTVTNWHHLVP